MRYLITFPIAFYLIVVGCTTNPVTNRQQLAIVSEQQIISSSYQAYSSIIQSAKDEVILNRDHHLTERVKEIGARLIPQAVRYRPEIINWEWDINVLEREELNAFCMAGGKIVIYSGLIKKIKLTDDELAQVLAHEIAHALSEHTREKISVALASNMVVAATGYGTGISQQQAKLLNELVTLALVLPNSRHAETEADAIGILLATQAGYDPFAAVTLWEKMSIVSETQQAGLTSTHPLPDVRMTQLHAEAENLHPMYKKTLKLRLSDKLPKIEYFDGKATNLYGKGRYELPSIE